MIRREGERWIPHGIDGSDVQGYFHTTVVAVGISGDSVSLKIVGDKLNDNGGDPHARTYSMLDLIWNNKDDQVKSSTEHEISLQQYQEWKLKALSTDSSSE